MFNSWHFLLTKSSKLIMICLSLENISSASLYIHMTWLHHHSPSLPVTATPHPNWNMSLNSSTWEAICLSQPLFFLMHYNRGMMTNLCLLSHPTRLNLAHKCRLLAVQQQDWLSVHRRYPPPPPSLWIINLYRHSAKRHPVLRKTQEFLNR